MYIYGLVRLKFQPRGEIMNKRTFSWILVTSTFLALVMVGVNAMAQATRPATPGAIQQAPPKGATATKAAQSAAQRNPACQQIVAECKKLGFIVGQWKIDNGLWKDCFDPVVKGGQATRDGKPIQVPVSPSTVQECRAAREQHQQGAQHQHGAQQMGATQPKQ